jgi:tetratricopeptide (TPR) repeat protein
LDDIIMVAMTKSPAQRFASVQELADELGRHLRGEPVRVRRARRRVLYVARKFVRRHRTGVGTAAAVLLVLVVMGGITLSAVLREQATLREKLTADAAKEAAMQESLVRAEFAGALWRVFGNRLVDVSMSAEDRERLWDAVVKEYDALAERYGGETPAVLDAMSRAYHEMGDSLGNSAVENVGQTEGAFLAYTKSARAIEQLLTLTPENDGLRYRAGRVLLDLAKASRELNRPSESVGAVERARAHFEAMDGSGEHKRNRSIGLMAAMQIQGQMAARECEVDLAIGLLESTLEIKRGLLDGVTEDPKLRANQDNVAKGHTNLAQALLLAGRPEEAEAHLASAMGLRRSILDRLGEKAKGREHFNIATTSLFLGTALRDQGRIPAALRELEAADGGAEALVAADSSSVNFLDFSAQVKAALAGALLENGETERAVRAAERAVEACDALDQLFPLNARNTEIRTGCEAALGEALVASGQYDAAHALLASSEQGIQRLLAADPERIDFRRRLAGVLIAMGDLERSRTPESDAAVAESRALYRRADEIYRSLEAGGRLCGVPEKQRAELAARLAE